MFKKDGSEVRRSNKLCVPHYCSIICVRKGRVTNKKGNLDVLIANNRKDKFTGLREHLTRVKKRDKNHDITLDDLLNVWEKQKGVCPYTGVKLIHPKDAKNVLMIYKASLDRIDSKLGYVKGNIQFISASANFGKGEMTHDEMIIFCKLITKHWS
jgi:hypothetical protein